MAQMCPAKSTIVPLKKQFYSSGSNLCNTNSHQTLNEAHRHETVQYKGVHRIFQNFTLLLTHLSQMGTIR